MARGIPYKIHVLIDFYFVYKLLVACSRVVISNSVTASIVGSVICICYLMLRLNRLFLWDCCG